MMEITLYLLKFQKTKQKKTKHLGKQAADEIYGLYIQRNQDLAKLSNVNRYLYLQILDTECTSYQISNASFSFDLILGSFIIKIREKNWLEG